MMISDDRLLTLEDKSLLKKLEEAEIAQAQSQLAYEAEGTGRPSIPQFVGILQMDAVGRFYRDRWIWVRRGGNTFN